MENEVKKNSISNKSYFSVSEYQIQNTADVGAITVKFITMDKKRTPQVFAEFIERITQWCAQ